MADNRSRRVRELMVVESYLIRTLKSFTSPAGISIGKGSVLYYPKKVANDLVKYGWGIRVSGEIPQIVSE